MIKNLAVCSWSLQPADPDDLAHKITQCGLAHTQLALDPIAAGEWDLDSVDHALSSAQIAICSGMITTIGEDYSTLDSIKATGGLRPDQHWEANQKRAQAAAIVANQLGLDLVTLHAGFIPDHGTAEYRTITDRIKAIADIFGKHGINLALETGQERAESLLEMLNEPNLSTIGINFDPANMILYAMGDPAKALELFQSRIVQAHMKNAITTQSPGTWGTEVPAEQGEVDWNHFFSAIHAFPKSINVVIEREAGDNRISDIIEARKIASKFGCPR